MTTNRTNRRAEDFDRALTAEGGAGLDPSLKALVAVAGALAAIPSQPAAPFKEALRTKLMAEAAHLAAAAPVAVSAASIPMQASPLKALPKVLAKPAMQVASGGLAAAIAVTGAGVGASRSLPGDSLYGVKRAVESLQQRLAGGTLAESDAALEQARTRVDEVVALLERDGAAALDEVQATLDDLKAGLDQATADLLAQARAGSRAAYDKLAGTVAALTDELEALRATLPAEAQDEFAAVMATLNGAAGQLKAMPKPDGGTPGTPGTPLTPLTPTAPVAPTTPPTSTVPTSPPPASTKPGTPPTKSPSTSPSAPTTTGPTIDVPTSPPVITVPPVTPSLPVTLPPALP